MRDVILLHANADAALAAAIAAASPRVWISDAVSSDGAAGAFGPRFHMVALWSPAAEAEGLAHVFVRLIEGRERPSIVLAAGGAVVPAALARCAAAIERADAAGLEAAFAHESVAAEIAARAKSASSWTIPRALPRALAAAALSVGFGAILAHATSSDRAQALDADFGIAPIEARKVAIIEAAPPAAGEDAIEAKVNSLFEKARAETASPAARARDHAVSTFRASPN